MSTRPPGPLRRLAAEQLRRNDDLVAATPLLAERFESRAVPFTLDFAREDLQESDLVALSALEKTAARIAIESLASLAKVNDTDHLGGGLDVIPPLLMTLALVDYEGRRYTLEHGHVSIGYYASLAAMGFIPPDRVIGAFRRSLDIAGHVSWLPGGTELSAGRLGVMVPVATGQSLGLRAHHGAGAVVICHCGDAGWISGQALDGMVAASLHRAPVVFVMHRNGIQLSGTTERIMNKDPRPIVSALGIRILEIPSFYDRRTLYRAYREAYRLAQDGLPAMVYPAGYRSDANADVTLEWFGRQHGILPDVEAFAAAHAVPVATKIWVPGSLMSFRDVHAMLQCLFYVNRLPGGEGHHDGGMRGRDAAAVLAHPMLQLSPAETRALQDLRGRPPRVVVTTARPPKGAPNLVLTADEVRGIELPGVDKPVTPRAGSEAAYAALAKKYPNRCFFVSCDLNPSTKVGKAAALVPAGHRFEMSIQEQAAALLTNGLAFSSREPQLNVFATFGAFIEGIAREGFEVWRYQRNLTGANEGLNVLMHLSHVGACTGRDHFSGWSLDWINFGLGYLPYLRRFYAPADARAAFLAIKDAASAMGGHIVGVPRDNVPVLRKDGTAEPLWRGDEEWQPVTTLRQRAGADTAILTVGAPSFLAVAAAGQAEAKGTATDIYVINGFPLPDTFLADVAGRYRRVVTLEDGLIGTPGSGLRGFAGLVAGELYGSDVVLEHLGICDPRVAPSEDYPKVWEHFGMTAEALAASLLRRH